MQPRHSWKIGFAATLLLTACASTPAISPQPLPEYQPPLGMTGPKLSPETNIPSPDPTKTNIPAPDPTVIPIKTTPETPAIPTSPVTIGKDGLCDPQGNVVNPVQAEQELPACIPQQNAAGYLQQLPGTLVNPNVANFSPYEGLQYGAIPDLLQYGALSNCLYYPYNNYYVPYILAGGCYYPYSYASCYNPLYTGWYAYPWFYSYQGYCYPYCYMSRNYCYGYQDWEYNWPQYRERYSRRYDEDNARDDRGQNFRRWRDDRLNREVPAGDNIEERSNRYFQRFHENQSNRRNRQREEVNQRDSNERTDRENRTNNRKDRVERNADAPVVIIEPPTAQREKGDKQESREIRKNKRENTEKHRIEPLAQDKREAKKASDKQNQDRGENKKHLKPQGEVESSLNAILNAIINEAVKTEEGDS